LRFYSDHEGSDSFYGIETFGSPTFLDSCSWLGAEARGFFFKRHIKRMEPRAGFESAEQIWNERGEKLTIWGGVHSFGVLTRNNDLGIISVCFSAKRVGDPGGISYRGQKGVAEIPHKVSTEWCNPIEVAEKLDITVKELFFILYGFINDNVKQKEESLEKAHDIKGLVDNVISLTGFFPEK